MFKLVSFIFSILFFIYVIRINKKYKKEPDKLFINDSQSLILSLRNSEEIIDPNFKLTWDKSKKIVQLSTTKYKTILLMKEWPELISFLKKIPAENLIMGKVDRKIDFTDIIFLFDL